ncbi:hypothetical protein JXA80_10565 [bacterium]|nr:hypothetical protein [candidate division CSSED10-310 bacterium]
MVEYGENTRLITCFGEGAEILWMDDDGQTWTRRVSTIPILGFTDIVELSGGRLIVTSSDGDLLVSDDVFQTYVNKTENITHTYQAPIGAIDMLPDGRAFAGTDPRYGVMDVLLMTRGAPDEEWEFAVTAPDIGRFNDIEFYDSDWGIAAGSMLDHVSFTIDGGMTWNARNIPSDYGLQMKMEAICMVGPPIASFSLISFSPMNRPDMQPPGRASIKRRTALIRGHRTGAFSRSHPGALPFCQTTITTTRKFNPEASTQLTAAPAYFSELRERDTRTGE